MRPRVLVLRALGLGDAITGIAALRAVRRRWPDAEVVIACPGHIGVWLCGLGVADRVLCTSGLDHLEWTGPPPDVAVNLHGRGPQSHRLLASLGPRTLVAFRCPAAGVRSGPLWSDDEHEVDRWLRLLEAAGATGTPEDLRLGPRPGSGTPRREGPVVIHPGAASVARRWPASRWAAVAAALADDHPIVVTGVSAEAATCAAVAADPRIVNRCGLDDLHGLTHLVAQARLVLSGDTGVAHLATALGTPSVTLFGPLSPDLWGPRLDVDLHTAVWASRNEGRRPGDPHGRELDERLARLGVAEVVSAAAARIPLRRAGMASLTTGDLVDDHRGPMSAQGRNDV